VHNGYILLVVFNCIWSYLTVCQVFGCLLVFVLIGSVRLLDFDPFFQRSWVSQCL